MARLRLICLSIALLALFSLTRHPGTAGATMSTGQSEPITVGVYDGEASLLAFVAESEGFYSNNGLNAKITPCQTGLQALERLVAGEVDFATVATFPFTRYSSQHSTIRIIASIATADSVELLVRKDRGITTPADLKEKKIGITLGTSSESFLRTFLLLRYISPDEVQMIDLSPAELVEAIALGEVDAAVNFEIFAYEIKKRMGESVLSWPVQDHQDYCFLMVTREDVIKAKPQAVERFVKSLVEAEGFVRTHVEEAKAIISRQWGREPAYVRQIWGRHLFGVSLDQSLVNAMEAHARAYRRATQETAPIPNYLEFIYFRGLDAVNPRAVTIFR
ncbi:MAG: ABC transporter substrate-binding protein [Syntrophobacteraceae bacterium]